MLAKFNIIVYTSSQSEISIFVRVLNIRTVVADRCHQLSKLMRMFQLVNKFKMIGMLCYISTENYNTRENVVTITIGEPS